MIDLTDVTFIIPIRVESYDRKTNAQLSLQYLCKYFKTNIIILEHDTVPKVPEILDGINKFETKINYHFLKSNDEIFHRTKFLNMMLNIVTTPVVVNYDVDILLMLETYTKCRDLIITGHDLVYPYFLGNSQHQVLYSGRDKLIDTLDLTTLTDTDTNINRSEFGHCQFFNTKSYIAGGMENEGFISYAPEDQERGYRFKKLGYKVMWSDDFVYHVEHTRGINSTRSNPMMLHNTELFNEIKLLSKEQLTDYYKNIEYLKKYTNNTWNKE